MNPIAFSVFGFEIYWYSLLILSAFVIGFFLVKHEIKKHYDIDNDTIYDYFFYLIPIAILGARLYYVIFEWNLYKSNPIEALKIWNGGLAIHGGLIASITFTYFYCKKKHINLFRFMDIIVPALTLGQAIGRWGNFFNQEAYGPVVNVSVLNNLHIPNFIVDGMYINGFYHHPTFLYESLTCFVIFIIIMLFRKFDKKLKVGTQVGIYFIIYGIERFLVESLRQDSLMIGSLKVAQLVSVLMFIAGIVFIVMSFKKNVSYIEPEPVKKKSKKGKK
jgi:phosphatidylglycerol:prolipoprotein diacylglycerol transferase